MEENKKEEVVEEKSTGSKGKLDKFFGITEKGSSFKVEIFAGIATFLAMAYILTVNPNQILSFNAADPKWSGIFIATALGAFIGTILMALLAKMPLAQASGMGLNSTVGLVIGGVYGFAFSFGNAMLLVLVSGILFLFVSFIPGGKDKNGKLISLREKIFDGMPVAVRTAIPVGIGLFIAFIGFQNARVIVDNPYTLLDFVNLTEKANWAEGGAARDAVVALFGVVLIAILARLKVKGAVVFGILGATLLALPLGVANIDVLKGDGGVTWKFWENFSNFFNMDPDKGGVAFAAFTEGFKFPKDSFMTCVMLVITFSMIDMFDTMGTVVGCTTNAGLIDENGKPLNYNKIMYSDSIATCAGAMLGTSTVTTFVESGAGIAAGGKTGFASLVTAVLFLLSIFILPVFAFIPSAACASALIYVGVLMMSNVVNIDFKDVKNAVPAFLTIVIMPFAYSITKGIGIGIIAYVVLSSVMYVVDLIAYKMGKVEEKPKWDLSIVLLVIFALFLVYFLVPTKF